MKIGVLGNEGSWYVDQLCRHARQRGHDAVALQFPELTATIQDQQIEFRFADVIASELDVLIVRTMPPGSLEQVVSRMDFLAGLAARGVRVINSPRSMECAVDKYLTTQSLVAAGLPVPDTVVCETSDAAMTAFDQLGRDVVVKPLFGSEGRGIVRVDQEELALRTFRTLERLNATLYLQRFINGPAEDLRLLLLDGKPAAAMKRRPQSGDFRANAAQRGITEPWQPTDEELDLAQRAAEVTGAVFSGIDLMYNDQQKPLIVEVNAVPGWRAIERTCRINVCDQFFAWLETS